MKRSTLPTRGFDIHPAFLRGRRIAMGICIAILVAMCGLAIYFVTDIFAMRREAAIWASGQAAPDATVVGDGTVKAVFVNYKIRVSYRAPDGSHTGVEEFATVGAGATLNVPASLRYDAAHPDDFATSWGIESAAGRWRWILIMGGFLVFVGGVMALQLRTSRREIRRTRAVARDGDEVEAIILSSDKITLSSGRETPHVKIKWRTGEHGPFTTQLDTRKGDVARTSRDGEAVAVISRDGKTGVLLRDDLYPLLATEQEIQAAAASRKRIL